MRYLDTHFKLESLRSWSVSSFPLQSPTQTFPIGYPSHSNRFQILLIYSSLLGFLAERMCLLIVVAVSSASTFSIYLKINFEAEEYIMWYSVVFIAISTISPTVVKLHILCQKKVKNVECSPQFIIVIIIMRLHFMSKKGKKHLLDRNSFVLLGKTLKRSFMRWCHDQMIGFSCRSFTFSMPIKKLNKLAKDLRIDSRNTSALIL